MSDSWNLISNAPLRENNTFHIHATAPVLLQLFSNEALPIALSQPKIKDSNIFVLGGGSNILFVDNPQSVLVSLQTQQLNMIEHRLEFAIVRVDAGVIWHDLVIWSLEQGLSGLENLALIPGTVGAAPIQNIGAYGTQVGEFIYAIDAYDLEQKQWVRFSADECQFAYRDSIFKQHNGRYILTSIEFKLPRLHELRLNYPGIKEELERMEIATPAAIDVAHAIITIRQSKLPDPNIMGNAGSFFKNPIINTEQLYSLQNEFPTIPNFPIDNQPDIKLSAAWLIQECGWKGFRDGDAGVSPDHALVLVNYGNASGQEIFTLARKISESVLNKFNIILEPEPNLIGAVW